MVHTESLKCAVGHVNFHGASHNKLSACSINYSKTSVWTTDAPDCQSPVLKKSLLFRSNQRHFSSSFNIATWYGPTLKAKATLQNSCKSSDAEYILRQCRWLRCNLFSTSWHSWERFNRGIIISQNCVEIKPRMCICILPSQGSKGNQLSSDGLKL